MKPALRLAGLCTVAALVGFTAAPLPEPAAALVQPRRDAWQVPTLPRRVDTTSLVSFAVAASFWGSTDDRAVAAAAAAAPTPSNRWRVAGVVGEGLQRRLLLVFSAEGQSPVQLSVGQTLPSGHRVVRIGDRDFCVQIGARAYRMEIERSEP